MFGNAHQRDQILITCGEHDHLWGQCPQHVHALGHHDRVGQALAGAVAFGAQHRRKGGLDAGLVDGQAFGGQVPLGVCTREDDRAIALCELHNGGELQFPAGRVARSANLQIVIVDKQDDPAWALNHSFSTTATS